MISQKSKYSNRFERSVITERFHSKTAQLPPHVRGCSGCGSKYSAQGSGNIHHPAALTCAEYGKFWRWVGRMEAQEFRRRGLLKAIAPVQKPHPVQPQQLTLDFWGGK